MLIERISPIDGARWAMDLPCTQAELDAYKAGALIQDAFPHCSPSEREFIKTGITPHQWNALFSVED